MKRILEILQKKQSEYIFLSDLRNETPYNKMDVFINPERNCFLRCEDKKEDVIKEQDYRRVLVSNLNVTPVITLKDNVIKYLRDCLKDGYQFLEVECKESGYPLLTYDGELVVSDKLKTAPITFSPTEALERIKKFNESYNNNHKLTPGLHESS